MVSAVQDDIAGFRQGFVFEVDDVLQWQFAADDRPDQFEAVTFRKDQQRPAGERAGEILPHRDQLGIVRPCNKLCCGGAGQDVD